MYLIYFISHKTFASVNAKDSKCKATGDLPFVLENNNNNNNNNNKNNLP